MQDKPIAKILPAPLLPGVWRADTMPEPQVATLMANGIISSDGITLIFAKGGTGKGLVCVELARALIEEGHTVLIVDFERHYSEWYGRIGGLIPADYKSRLYGMNDDAVSGSIKDMEETLSAAIRDYRVTVLILDSYGWAKPRVGNKGTADPQSAEAIEFGNALMRLGVPTLVTTHVAKNGKRPEPYGSVYLTNVCRAVWSLDKLPVVVPNQNRLQLRWHKGNGYEPQPDAVMTFTFSEGQPVSCEWVATYKTLVDKIYGVLLQNDATHGQIYDILKERYPRDTSIKAESIRQTCLMYSREGVRQKFIRLPKSNQQAPQVFRAKR